MRRPLLLIAFAATMASPLAAPSPAKAQGRIYPWCLRVADRHANYIQCHFDTLQQCQWSASGRAASCERNLELEYLRQQGLLKEERAPRKAQRATKTQQ